ncbi:MAG TPA: hypothetical protein VGI72_00195 [Gaiellales bacterium]
MTRLPPRVLAALLTVCVLPLAGCGGSSGSADRPEPARPAAQILRDAHTAVAAATSVHLSGHVTSTTPVILDLHLDRTGGSGAVSSKGIAFRVTRIGNAAYFTGTQAFYRHFTNAAGIALLNGKWLKVPATDTRFSAFSALTDMTGLLGQVLQPSGTVVKAGTRTLDGLRVIALHDTTNRGTLYVAATGAPYPVEVVTGGAHPALVKFDHWNQAITLRAPSPLVHLWQLQKLATASS